MQPILFKLQRLRLNMAGTGIRKRGVAPMRPAMGLPAVKSTLPGVSRDSTGAALAGCTTTLFKVRTNGPFPVFTQIDVQVSDGGGNYSFVVGLDGPYRVTWDLDGAPIRAGISLRTLAGSVDGR